MKNNHFFICLELHESFLKLCNVHFKNGQKPVFQFFKKEIVSKDDTGISKEIRDFFTSLNFSKKEVILNVPRQLVIASFLKLPSVDEAEIRRMVEMESVSHIPATGEEMITDFKIIEKDEEGFSRVFYVVVQSAVIKRLIFILKEAGLELQKAVLGSESLMNWYFFVLKKKTEESTDRLSTALINMDSESININIMQNEKLTFTRSLFYEGDTEKAVSEVRKTIAIYQKKSKRSGDKIVISGADQKVDEITPFLKEGEAMPLHAIPQGQEIEIDESSQSALKETSFIELIGLSLSLQHTKIDLLPTDLKEKIKFKNFRKRLSKTLIILSFLILAFFILTIKSMFDRSNSIHFLDKKLGEMQAQVSEVRMMREDLKIMKTEAPKKPLAIDILAEVYKITPSNIKLNTLNYESGKELLLKCSSDSLEGAIGFVSLLEKSPYFENVKIKYTSKRHDRTQEVTDFEVAASLVKGKK